MHLTMLKCESPRYCLSFDRENLSLTDSLFLSNTASINLMRAGSLFLLNCDVCGSGTLGIEVSKEYSLESCRFDAGEPNDPKYRDLGSNNWSVAAPVIDLLAVLPPCLPPPTPLFEVSIGWYKSFSDEISVP
jgi:hypothetical protein